MKVIDLKQIVRIRHGLSPIISKLTQISMYRPLNHRTHIISKQLSGTMHPHQAWTFAPCK